MQTKEKTILLVFAIASIGNLASTLLDASMLNYLTKPLLLLPLLVAWQSTTLLKTRFDRLIAGAFLFSWFGDLLLMMVSSAWGQKVPFFILGLGCFLVAHLFFIAAFWHCKGKRTGLIQQKPWLLVPFLLFWGILMYILWPGLGDLRIPVTAYSLVIIVMTASAHNLWPLITKPYRTYLSIGTILFVLSDSLIAVNKFASSFPGASFAIMLTYIVAQYLIYWGAKGMRN
ncbi:lysoplasmalogenase [Haliscomenobacter sp.]|uniref:lysoplasmalogenase n=1 Tax=Haliscomenobacter sp. TaxID=2717303 RepID=UPI003593788A